MVYIFSPSTGEVSAGRSLYIGSCRTARATQGDPGFKQTNKQSKDSKQSKKETQPQTRLSQPWCAMLTHAHTYTYKGREGRGKDTSVDLQHHI